MIESYWGLLHPPFSLDPDARFLFESSAHREGLSRLLFAVRELRGTMTVLTGDIGCGKTTLGRALERLLPTNRFRLVYVPHPMLPAGQLLAAVGRGFGMKHAGADGTDPGAQLEEQLASLSERNIAGVLVIDESQLLTRGQLEQLRLLTNLETATTKLLHIVLIGQPELTKSVASYPELAQRIAMRFHLRPLTFAETSSYLKHRLRVAGAGRPIFTDAAMAEIYRHTGGVPRLVNLLAAHALFLAAAGRRSQVEAAAVASAAKELDIAMTQGRGSSAIEPHAVSGLTGNPSPTGNPTTSPAAGGRDR